MKVLLLSISTGAGHHSTAKAIKKHLESLDIECEMIDAYEQVNKLLSTTISQGYELTTKSPVSKTYSQMYRLAEKRGELPKNMSITRFINSIGSGKLEKYIKDFNPDVIICTHVFACIMVDTLKAKKRIKSTCIGVVTDFKFHPFWEEVRYFDYVVTANEILNIQAIKKGFSVNQVLPFGIPINPKFSNGLSKIEAREKLDIDTEKLTFLIMSGSMGYGNVEKIIQTLDDIELDFQIINVCGNNKRAKRRIDKFISRKYIMNLGYCDYIEMLMDAADCIITKPGGLTVSEALAKRLPLVLVNPIPGQEDRNVEYLLNNGAAMYATKTYPLDEIIYQIYYYPEKLEFMKQNIEIISKPDSTKDLCEFVKSLS